ncbi:MerR family transcriptional regulator [Blastococcus xanthinilyticus]|uniref:DNA-binding transcriptional MerR regulator n=1 Tax=Blastococcus xanthinilyticus TaxID=1564164 RepID=A0A5S5CU09_9ACTN|nr:MerR family transcriptional regulator [Blastococcus xanthinilyticus]TYP86468.1 DNA-binding transcriptional MerR regulator [Blastococcus xanthinilyticus]
MDAEGHLDLDLLTIGSFARAVGLPTSALRHYDECGLLVPARTDASTGYRYYTPALEQRGRLIAMMRGVGVPIEQMRLVLDGDAEQARDVLAGLAAGREQEALRTREALGEVLTRLERQRPQPAVRLRASGPVLAAALQQVRTAADTAAASPLAAVLLDARDGLLDVVATNRHWLARRVLGVRAEGDGEARVVLGLPTVDDLVDRLERSREVDLVLRAGEGLTVATGADALEIAGDPRPYPSYRLVLDALDPPGSTVLVPAESLVRAVTRAHRAVVLLRYGERFRVGDVEVPAVVAGAGLEVGFRSSLLLRALGSCVGRKVQVDISAADRPAVLTSPDQPGFEALVMPTLERP